MLKTRLLTESESKDKPQFMDYKKYQERLNLDLCEQTYIKSNKSGLSKEQVIVLKEYFEYLVSTRRLKARSIFNYITSINYLGKKIPKPYSLMTKKDLITFFASLSHNSINYVINYQQGIKKFFAWLGNEDIVKDIRYAKRPKTQVTKDQILTREEIMKMIGICQHERDKSLIMLLYELGPRVGELINIKLKDITVLKDNKRWVRIDGKTGIRNLPITLSLPYVHEWMNMHEFKNDDAPLLYSFAKNEYGRFLNAQSVNALVKMIAHRAGITKHVFNHLFRHTRATELGKYLTERQMRQFFGWTEDSDMPSRYMHNDMEEVDERLDQINGIQTIKQPDTFTNIFTPITCVCGKINTPDKLLCKCGATVLDTESILKRQKIDDTMNWLCEHKEFLDIVKKLIKEKKT